VSAQTFAARPFFYQSTTVYIFVVDNIDRCCHATWVAGQRECTDLHRTSGSGRAGMERRDRGERGEAGGPRLGPWTLVEPCYDPIHIDRCGGRDVLQVSFFKAPIAGLSQAKGPHPLRERPFDSRTTLIALECVPPFTHDVFNWAVQLTMSSVICTPRAVTPHSPC
jgi:hypothetical protein